MYKATQQVCCGYCKAYGKKLTIKCNKCGEVYFCSEEHKSLDKHDCSLYFENKDMVNYLTDKYYELGAYIVPYIYQHIKYKYIVTSVSLLETDDNKLALQIRSDRNILETYADSIKKIGSDKIIELELGFIRGCNVTIYTSHAFFPEKKICDFSTLQMTDKIKGYINIQNLDDTLAIYKNLIKK